MKLIASAAPPFDKPAARSRSDARGGRRRRQGDYTGWHQPGGSGLGLNVESGGGGATIGGGGTAGGAGARAGVPGTLFFGGAGGSYPGMNGGEGGGGGGGYYGGGGGSAGDEAQGVSSGGGGGGAGSSFAGTGTSNVSITTDTTGTPQAIVSWTIPVPAVTGVSPSSGAAAGGTTVTITGSGFTGATGVSFGGTLLVPGGFTVNSDTQITATSPAHAAGGVDVRVTTPGGTSPADPAVDAFTFAAPPGPSPPPALLPGPPATGRQG